MKRIAGILFATAMALVPLAAQEEARAPEARAPEARVPEARFEADTRILDLGEVVRGEVVEAEFTIGNSGDALLEIIDAVPG